MRAGGRRVRLRKAVPADLPALEALERDCFAPERQSSRRSMRDSLRSPSQQVWVAEADNGLAGAMILFLYPRSLRIYSVAVSPQHRDLGAGRRFVRLAKALAARTRRRRVTLEADVNNAVLIGWYRDQGFRITEELEDYYAPGQPACRMVCEISKPVVAGGSA
jgi:ribosomal protein S18 acetylase RimI-like enzyme